MPTKEQMIKALKDSCGGMCLTDPLNCVCFEPPTQEIADDIGVDLEDMDHIQSPEDCMHYQNQIYFTRKDMDFTYNATVEYLVGSETLSITKEEAERFVKECFNNGLSMMDTMTKGLFIYIKDSNSYKVKDNSGYIYLLISEECVKIGRSISPRKRTEHLKTLVPFDILDVKHFKVKNCVESETYLHRHFKDKRMNGEWFSIDRDNIDGVVCVILKNPINGVYEEFN